MHFKPAHLFGVLILAGVAIGCRVDPKHVDSTTVIPSAVALGGDATGGASMRRQYTLLRMEANSSLPFEEKGYTIDCSRVTLSGTFEVEGNAWSQRDSVRYRCTNATSADSVETTEGLVRLAGDTLHLDVLRDQQPWEVEIARISGDTLKTGLGISGSTPRLYSRTRQLRP